jgi:phage tail-like protein
MAEGTTTDPYRSYNFKLEIQGVTQGHFTECNGLGIQVEAIKYREGGLNQVVRRIPGPVEYGDVVLRYGLTASVELWDWFMTVVDGQTVRKNVTVVMLGSDGSTPVLRWDLIDCWPSAWRGAPLDALGREVAIESLTLVFETLQRGT